MFPRLISLFLLVLIAVTAALPAAAADLPRPSLKSLLGALEDPEVPEAWGGIWDTEIELYFCGFPTPLFTDSSTDTLCPGDMVDTGEQDAGITCTGTANETTIEMTCTASEEVTPGCTMNMQIDYDGVRDGDSYGINMTIDVTHTGDCIDVEDSCTEAVITGTRVGPAPASCATPVDEVTWGTIKTRYE